MEFSPTALHKQTTVEGRVYLAILHSVTIDTLSASYLAYLITYT